MTIKETKRTAPTTPPAMAPGLEEGLLSELLGMDVGVASNGVDMVEVTTVTDTGALCGLAIADVVEGCEATVRNN